MSLEMFENCLGPSRGADQSSPSWMLLDSTGQGTVLEEDKYRIMRRFQIQARDLRILDPLLYYPSTILGRKGAIVLNLEHIKAIITPREVLLRDPMDVNVLPVFEELQRRLAPTNANQLQKEEDGKEYSNEQNDVEAGDEDDFPFEFRALEVVLEAICRFFAARTTELMTTTNAALGELNTKISSTFRNLETIHKLESEMTELTGRVQKVRDELEQLLDNEDNMANLYLTRKLAVASSSRGKASMATVRGDEYNVKVLEMLLEGYLMRIYGILKKLTKLRQYINDIKAYNNTQLNNHRSRLVQVGFFLNSGNICLTILALLIGIYGTNIPYIRDDDHGSQFKWVVVLTGIAIIFLFSIGIKYVRYKVLLRS